MKKWYNKYLNEDYKFDKLSWIGIFCLLIVITGIFGFLGGVQYSKKKNIIKNVNNSNINQINQVNK